MQVSNSFIQFPLVLTLTNWRYINGILELVSISQLVSSNFVNFCIPQSANFSFFLVCSVLNLSHYKMKIAIQLLLLGLCAYAAIAQDDMENSASEQDLVMAASGGGGVATGFAGAGGAKGCGLRE